jgi:hypothetical protein
MWHLNSEEKQIRIEFPEITVRFLSICWTEKSTWKKQNIANIKE